jgi:predicted tellurium resistance membrane protein TerC
VGVFGAILMRALFIAVGAALLERFACQTRGTGDTGGISL